VTRSIPGGAFLLTRQTPQDQFIPEELGVEHLAIARTVQEFWTNEVEPDLEAIRRKEPGVLLKVLRKSAELGLTGISIPERFGGMDLDLAAVMIIEECFARDASYLVTHGGQAGIGALPLVFFGTEQQKARYLPKLAAAEMIAAYALTEPQAGSDALAVRTRADLSADGKHYILNGQKMWITNGGIADLFTAFAKVGGERFTAFLVERGFPGVNIGAEEKKMGLHGSSTTAVFFDNVLVPVENVLGEIGRGHVIAFNVLNIGRLKIGPYAAGASKEVLAVCLKYAKQRKAFGSAIVEFGAIQHKLAEMAVRIFAVESMFWRVVGMIEASLMEAATDTDEPAEKLKAIEEYAIECSIVKVFASEAVGYVTDEGVQIHGGYGYHQDYAVERFYRDARIFRIFEGTNEINRLLIVSMFLKREGRGRLSLTAVEPQGSADDPVAQGKNLVLAALRAARETFGAELEKQQEVVMAISDIIVEVFAMESAWLRAQKLAAAGKGANAQDLFAVLLHQGTASIENAAREVFTACGKEAPRMNANPVDAIALRRKIARRLLDADRYVA
jgi:alkylation response protein AidB-like acyl-CoA dehydrogenase